MRVKTASLQTFQNGLNNLKSNIKLLLILLFLGFAIFLILSSYWRTQISPPAGGLKSSEPYHLACPYSIGDYQVTATSSASAQKIQAKAVIVSHHLLARDLIGDTLGRMANDYQTIIVIGPNHFNLGLNHLQTTNYSFKTKFGNLKPNQEIIDELVEEKIASIHDENFNNEHSICSLVSFVKIYFPYAKIVPITLKGNAPLQETKKLASFLAQNCNQKCLIIASLDFSHDVSPHQAKSNDQQSAQILKNLEQENLEKVVCDSIPTLQALMGYLKKKGVANGEIVHHSDSNQLTQQDLPTVTSYLTIIY